MKMIVVKVPGKIILSGEHSVVYGKPALVASCAPYLTLSVSESLEKNVPQDLQNTVFNMEKIVKNHLNNHNVQDVPYSVEINSEIPVGRGMGSSAALCVALSAALLKFYTGKTPEKETVNNLAYLGEKYFHGMPSGVDVSAVCYSGLIFYRKEFEFLKQISALNFKIPKNIEDSLLLVDSGRPVESTAEMVRAVGTEYNKHPKYMEKAFMEIEKCTKRMVVSIVKEDPVMFEDTIRENGELLVKLKIVSKKTQSLMREIGHFGAVKVTGAGGSKNGSGMMLCFVKDKAGMNKFLKKNKLWNMPFKQDYQGFVCQEK